jgi:hypothetical protein
MDASCTGVDENTSKNGSFTFNSTIGYDTTWSARIQKMSLCLKKNNFAFKGKLLKTKKKIRLKWLYEV